MQAGGSTKPVGLAGAAALVYFANVCHRPRLPDLDRPPQNPGCGVRSHVLDANNVAGQKAAGNGRGPGSNPAEGSGMSSIWPDSLAPA